MKIQKGIVIKERMQYNAQQVKINKPALLPARYRQALNIWEATILRAVVSSFMSRLYHASVFISRVNYR